MFELIVRDRCTGCQRCVQVCPTNVLEVGAENLPFAARIEHCQTCFMCELYCPSDAVYVGPDRDAQHPVNEADIVASGLLGQFRRDSGWDEWADDPQYENQIWKLGPYIQAGGKQSTERILKLRAARKAQQTEPSRSGDAPKAQPER
jgi:NAD-dependent dihydropyrimidine dehydrogenase PreA subunit